MDQTSEQAQIFNDSYERVTNGPAGKNGQFYRSFYALLIATSPEAADKFRNTDMDAQIRMLRASISILLAFFGTGSQDEYLQKLAERHGKHGVDISPPLYSVWLDCLIATVSRFDPKFTDEVAAAWRTVFSKGIDFMASRYQVGETPASSL